MTRQTTLSNLIDSTEFKIQYDKMVKKILANKAILAWILKCCVKEFEKFDVADIQKCIEGTPDIGSRAVHQDELDVRDVKLMESDSSVLGMNTEHTSFQEQTVYFDIKFTATVPDTQDKVQLIINVEAQLRDYPGYPIEKRVIYYLSRMISAQYGTVFNKSQYGKLKKVYSIWICPEPARKRENTIKSISFGEKALYGKPDVSGSNSDLMEGIIISLGKPNDDIDNDVLKLLNMILSPDVTAEDKKYALENVYNIAVVGELESEVQDMCNLSQGIEMGTKVGFAEKMILAKEPVKKIVEFTELPMDAIKEIAARLHVQLTEEE